jgi:hypothetical protein
VSEHIDLTYLKALLESAAFLKSGGGFSKAVNVPRDLYAVVPFMAQLVIASEILVEGEVYIDGELFIE